MKTTSDALVETLSSLLQTSEIKIKNNKRIKILGYNNLFFLIA